MTKVTEHYARKDIQKLIIESASNKEVAIRYSDKGYGKRPDSLYYEHDVYELAKAGATSFHISEELWQNPLLLKPGLAKSQLDSLRTGWDFLIDIDSKDIETARKTAILIREALKFHNIKNFSVKFSGNSGFHIGIPSEAFPEKFNNIPIQLLFPEAPRVMAAYLKEMIREHLAASLLQEPLENLLVRTGKHKAEVTEKLCKVCNSKAIELKQLTFKCPSCRLEEQKFSESVSACPECSHSMSRIKEEIYLRCPKCSTHEPLSASRNFSAGNFNPFSLVEIDTILISSRHLFRAPYSINEKSGLVSIPIKPETLECFKKEQASIKKFVPGPVFLNRNIKAKEAVSLLTRAYEFYAKTTEQKSDKPRIHSHSPLSGSISQEHFSPCIKLGLKGLADGKKRFIFILYNFLSNTGYSHEEIASIMSEWNKKNPEPLRENYIQAQLSWSKRQKQKILPPNCNNQAYYPALGICHPDGLCRLIKNPVNYAILSSRKQQAQAEQEKSKQGKAKLKTPARKAKPVKAKQKTEK